jgi:hypothetical protein
MKTKFWLIGALLAVAVAGCGSNPEVQIERDAAPESAASSAPTASEPALPDVAAFGDTVTFADGMTVTVQSAGLKPASASAYGAVDGKIAAVQITVTNEGDEVVDAGGVSTLTASAGEAGVSAPSAADEGIDNPTLGSILPGETRTAVFGFGLSAADAQKLRLEIYGNNHSDSVVFAGAIS